MFKSRKWLRFNSYKECDLSFAKFQGKTALTSNYEKNINTNIDKRKIPLIFEIKYPPKIDLPKKYFEMVKEYKAKNGKRFQRLVMGKKSGDEIIDAEKEANNMILWALRIIGIMLVIGGLKGIFGFLETILKVVPFVANIFGWGVGVVCTVIGIVWSLIVIALAWLFYRPLLGIGLLVLAGFLVWVFAFKGKDKLKELAAKGSKNNPQPVPQSAE